MSASGLSSYNVHIQSQSNLINNAAKIPFIHQLARTTIFDIMTEGTTVILGTGIIGISTAYYLSRTQPGTSIHLVEAAPTLFASASGYAGGFLAANWFSPPVTALGKLSFEEHRRLAGEFSGREKWGYERSTSVSYATGRKEAKGKRGDDWLRQGTSRQDAASGGAKDFVGRQENDWEPRWIRRTEGDDMEIISEAGSTAQVDPLQLCQFLLQSSLDRGVQLHHPATAISVGKDIHDKLSSIRICNSKTGTETDVRCAKILIAAGAWSPQVHSILFPLSQWTLPISSLAGHSLVIRSSRWSQEHEEKGCHAVFASDEDGYSPEIFSRLGGEIYIAGLNSSSISLPRLATESLIDETSIQKLKETASRLLGFGDDNEGLNVVRKGLCFRPVTTKGTPILARLPDHYLGEGFSTRGHGDDGGVWLAAGHGPWGIALSLGSGKVMAEIIQGKPSSVDISGLSL